MLMAYEFKSRPPHHMKTIALIEGVKAIVFSLSLSKKSFCSAAFGFHSGPVKIGPVKIYAQIYLQAPAE